MRDFWQRPVSVRGCSFPLRPASSPVTIHPAMLKETELAALLRPFDVRLTGSQIAQLQTYLELLLRWNSKINLTAIRRPEKCVTRHFGESLFLARWVNLAGSLLDIGSGAGFPGLAFKITFPELKVTLLEPTAKKRAFLKEVARACEFRDVEVCGQRLEEFADGEARPSYDSASSRAVGHFDKLLSLTARCLKPGGRLYLWLSRNQGLQLGTATDCLRWDLPIPIPLTREGEIWQATRQVASAGS
jgi:16S rRNA (guanine527-N7)-methyltransferase